MLLLWLRFGFSFGDVGAEGTVAQGKGVQQSAISGVPVAFFVVVSFWFALGCEGVGGSGDGAADAEREAEDGEGGEELHFGGGVVGLFVCVGFWCGLVRCDVVVCCEC